MSEGYWQLVELVWNTIDIDGVESFLATYYAAPPRSAVLYAAHFCQLEVCNGGFQQFFSNGTGVLAPEAVAGFRVIGQDGVAAVVQAAMNEFGLPYPRDRTLRTLRLSGSAPNNFDVLDSRFYALIGVERGGFQAAADRYATQPSSTDIASNYNQIGRTAALRYGSNEQ